MRAAMHYRVSCGGHYAAFYAGYLVCFLAAGYQLYVSRLSAPLLAKTHAIEGTKRVIKARGDRCLAISAVVNNELRNYTVSAHLRVHGKRFGWVKYVF